MLKILAILHFNRLHFLTNHIDIAVHNIKLPLPDFRTQVCLGVLAELAVPALWDVEWDDMITRTYRCHTFSHTLNNTWPHTNIVN